MKKLLFILLFFISISIVWGQDNPYDTNPALYEAPGDSTQYYALGIFRIGSDPGGWENLNTWGIDSLLNALVIYTDTTQLFIRNDTLFINSKFLQSAIDSIVVDSLTLNQIDFVPDSSVAWKEGRIFYDPTKGTLVVYGPSPNVEIEVGREFIVRIQNGSASTIANGRAVRPVGSTSSGVGIVKPASAFHDSTSNVLGIATESILSGAYGEITRFGYVRDLNTSALGPLGTTLYLDASNPADGSIIDTKPSAPYNIVPLGGLTKISVDGNIYAAITRFDPENGNAFIGFNDSSNVMPLTVDIESRITNTSNNFFNYDSSVGRDTHLSGDTLYLSEVGVYLVNVSYSFRGGSDGLYQFTLKQNGTYVPNSTARRKTTSADVGNVGFNAAIRTTSNNTPVTFWVVNTGNSQNITLIDGTITVTQLR